MSTDTTRQGGTPVDTRVRPTTALPPARSSREIWIIMSGLLLCILLAMLDNTVVGPALPTIVGDLGGLDHLSWVLTSYTLAMAVTSLMWGKLGDLFGRKPALLVSIGLFLTGSALTGLSQSMLELIGFRALQGVGAGGLMVGVIAVIAELVSPRERGRYTGAVSAVMPIAMIGGPLVGGWITDHASWHWIFYINLPIGLLAMAVVVATLHLPARPERGRPVIDWTGAGLLAVWASSAVLFATWAGTRYGWGSWQLIGLGAVTVLGLLTFVWHEGRTDEPILPLEIFRSRNFTLSGALTFLGGMAMLGAAAYLPQFQQLVQGESATSSGVLLLPMMLGLMVASFSVGQLMTRTGRSRAFALVGASGLTLGMALFTQLHVDTGTLATGAMMAVLGLGLGSLMQPSQLIAQNSVGLRVMGAAMGANKFLQTMGMSIGTAIMGSLYTARLRDSLEASLGAEGQHLASGGAQVPPSVVPQLPTQVQDALQLAVTHGIQGVFWVGAAAAALGLVAALLVREVPMRTSVDSVTP
jgi:EmrB/QacA subfamily drug resistance transporter